ncbi:MAG: hypothetical protein VKJ04_10630 [Vampirovibrionales bacterium]|nr:hypothetical protein [Vampirovibrionales bacterium]
MQISFGAIREFRPKNPQNPAHIEAAYNAAVLERGQLARNFRPAIETQALEGNGFGPYRIVTEGDCKRLSAILDEFGFSEALDNLCGKTSLRPTLYEEFDKAVVEIFYREADARGAVEKYLVDDKKAHRVDHFDRI